MPCGALQSVLLNVSHLKKQKYIGLRVGICMFSEI